MWERTSALGRSLTERLCMRISSLKNLLALLFALSLIAAACSGDEESSDDSTDDTTEAASDSTDSDAADDEEMAEDDEEMAEDDGEMAEDDGEMAEADLAGSEVTITGPERAEEEAGAIQYALDQFAAEHDMTITYAGSADWEAEINVAVEAGNAPDISIFPQPGKLADFARAGHLQPLTDDVAASVATTWSDSWLTFGNVDGTQVGVPAKADVKSLVWYKPARFDELGYTVPETWDDLMALTDQAIADGNTPWCVGIESGQATGWPFTDWIEDIILRTQGPDVYDQWVAGEVKFSDDRILDAFNIVGDLWSKDGAVFASGGSIATTAFGDNGQALVDDDCLMHRQASFFSAFIPEGTVFGADGVDVFYFPGDGSSKPVLGAGTLAAGFNAEPATMAVLEYFGSAEYANIRQAKQVELKGGDGALSGFLTAAGGTDTSLWAPLEQSMLEVLQGAEVSRFDGSDLMPADVGAGTFWSEGTSFVNGDKDAATAAAAIDASWPS